MLTIKQRLQATYLADKLLLETITYRQCTTCLRNGSPKSRLLTCGTTLSVTWGPYIINGVELLVISYTLTIIARLPASWRSKFSTNDSTSNAPPRYLHRETEERNNIRCSLQRLTEKNKDQSCITKGYSGKQHIRQKLSHSTNQ